MERTTLKFKQLINAVLGIFIVSLLISGCSGKENAKNPMRRISAGYFHSVAIKNDGTVWFWGEKLIHGKKDCNVLVPEKVKGINNAVQVSAGHGYTLVLKKDGTVWEFGGDKDGWIPTQVKGLSEVVDISAGYDYYCLALKKDGTVWAWKYPSSNDTSWAGLSLHKINELTGVKKVEAGEGVAAALKNDGTLWEWREDIPEQAFKPTMVKGLRDIIDISLGSSIIAALKNDGTLFIAGEGLGVPLKVDSPIKKYDIKGIVGISAKDLEWAALLKDGTVMKGGYSFEDNKNILKTPLLVPGINDAVGISDGGSRLLILKKDGSMAAMGSNFEGESGDGTMTGRRLPVKAAFNIDPNIIVKLKNVDPKKDLIYSVGDQKAKEMDQLSDKIIKMLDNQIDKTQCEVVKVSDAEQFVKNIKSNTDIVLDHGKNYVLTDILDRSADNNNTGDAFTNKGLIIKAVDNLKIRSDGNELANIMVSPLYSNVIIFEDCNNITIENIRAGHEPKKLSTSGDVFVFKNCKNIKIMGSTLYSGDGGVSASGVEDMLFKNSIIEDCTYSLITMENSKNILFKNSKLRNTSDADYFNSDIINIKDSENVVFTNCDITKNMASGKYGEHIFWNIQNVLPMLIVRDTSISDNTAAYFRTKRDNIYFSNVNLLNNTFTKGSYVTD